MISLDELESVTPGQFGWGVVWPAVLTAGIFAAALRLPARWVPARGLIGAVALAVAIYGAFVALGLGPHFRPEGANHWLPHLAVFAIPAGWMAGQERMRREHVIVLGLTAIVAALPLDEYSPLMRLFSALLLGYASFLSALALIHARLSGAATALAMAVTAWTASLFFLAVGGPTRAQIAGILMACCAGAALVLAIWGRDPEKRLARGLAPGFTVVLTALLFLGYFGQGANVPSLHFLLVGLAPVALLVTRLGPVARRAAPARTLIGVAALAVPLTIALVRANLG